MKLNKLKQKFLKWYQWTERTPLKNEEIKAIEELKPILTIDIIPKGKKVKIDVSDVMIDMYLSNILRRSVTFTWEFTQDPLFNIYSTSLINKVKYLLESELKKLKGDTLYTNRFTLVSDYCTYKTIQWNKLLIIYNKLKSILGLKVLKPKEHKWVQLSYFIGFKNT